MLLALNTLGSFDFGSKPLLILATERVVPFLDDDDANTRREAALTACRLIERRAGPRPARCGAVC